MAKVDFNYRLEPDYLKNYKELQKAFDAVQCPKVGAGGTGWQGLCTRCWLAVRNSAPAAWRSAGSTAGLAAGVPSAAVAHRRRPPGIIWQEFNPSALSKGKLQDNNEFMQVSRCTGLGRRGSRCRRHRSTAAHGAPLASPRPPPRCHSRAAPVAVRLLAAGDGWHGI